jgi:hypothetical protein
MELIVLPALINANKALMVQKMLLRSVLLKLENGSGAVVHVIYLWCSRAAMPYL